MKPVKQDQNPVKQDQDQKQPVVVQRIRQYACATCGQIVEAEADARPQGWYQIRRLLKYPDMHTHGLYCSARCMASAAQRLASQEKVQVHKQEDREAKNYVA